MPGFFEVDPVAHCGHTLAGQHAWTLTATDVHTGWTTNAALPNRAQRWAKEAIELVADTLPYPMVGLDADNGGEFINHQLVEWVNARGLRMTRSRPHTSNDSAHVGQRNGDWVRRYSFRYRYDTPTELGLPDQLWEAANLLKNYILPCKKVTGFTAAKAGRSRRTYNTPRTPCQRVLDSGVLTPIQACEPTTIRDGLNPAELTRTINQLQTQLIAHARARTHLEAA